MKRENTVFRSPSSLRVRPTTPRRGARVLASVAATALCLSAGAAWAGTAGVAFPAPYDFDGSGESDLLLHRLSGTNTGINEIQLVTGTTSSTRGWPDLNWGNTNTREYETVGAGRFDPAGGAAIVTRKISNSNVGLFRIVELAGDGITRATSGQHFLGGSDASWTWLGAGDVNGDGADDLVLTYSGLVRVVFMDPANPYHELQTTHPGSLPQNNDPLGVADADGDGKADVYTVDRSNGIVEVLISGGTGPFAGSQMPTAVPAGWAVRGIGLFNRSDSRADLLFEAGPGTGTPGLLRIDYAGDAGGSANAPASTFPALLDAGIGENVAAVGDYDGLNQLDIASRLSAPANPANEGAVTIRLMNGDGTDLSGAYGSLPQIRDLQWEIVEGDPQ